MALRTSGVTAAMVSNALYKSSSSPFFAKDNDELIDIESSLINVVGDFKFSQPELVTKEQGGTHTAGMIQYAYTLYRLKNIIT